jgi:natural product biosynthesis luciferase-like monooxygenase protein
MKFGMLHLFESPMGRSDDEMVREQIELMEAAEELGFDSVWPAEHHFSEYGFCASPALSLAAIARRTTRLRLGTGVVVLPFHNPVRVAEDYAMLDNLSGGRVELGVGRGYQPIEYAGFGIDQAQSREIFDEALEVIRRAWTHERLDFEGVHFRFHDVEVRPRPLQQPHPPIWLAALSEDTYEKAARIGANLLCSPVFGGSLVDARHRIERYRETLADEGIEPADRQVGALVMVYVADTQEQARREFADPVIWYFRTFGKYVAPKVGQPPVPTYEWYPQIRDLASVVEWDQLLAHGAVICGEPDYVAERVAALRDVVGVDHLLCWTRLGGLATSKVAHHMELMRDRVIPQLRDPIPTT